MGVLPVWCSRFSRPPAPRAGPFSHGAGEHAHHTQLGTSPWFAIWGEGSLTGQVCRKPALRLQEAACNWQTVAEHEIRYSIPKGGHNL